MSPLNQHVYLTGYRGCGKSTVRKLLADQLGRASMDLDDAIEESAGQTIAEIFAAESETGFRRRECEMLQTVSQTPPQIIALGGGTILDPSNRQTISETGVCVWLDADNATLASRIAGDATTADRRPALTDRPLLQEVETVMAMRRPIYQSVADVRVDTTDRPIADIVAAIVAALPK